MSFGKLLSLVWSGASIMLFGTVLNLLPLKVRLLQSLVKRNGFAVLWCVSPNEGIGDQESEMVARCLNVVSVRICSTVGGNSFSCSKWPNDTTVHRDTNVVQGPYHINHLGLIHIALPKPANQANQDIHTRTQPPSLLTSAADKINDCFAWRHFQVFNYVQLHLIRQGRNVDDVFFFFMHCALMVIKSLAREMSWHVFWWLIRCII